MTLDLLLGHASFLQGNNVPSILYRVLPKQSFPDNNISGILFKIIRPKEQLKASLAVSTWLFFFCYSFSFMQPLFLSINENYVM